FWFMYDLRSSFSCGLVESIHLGLPLRISDARWTLENVLDPGCLRLIDRGRSCRRHCWIGYEGHRLLLAFDFWRRTPCQPRLPECARLLRRAEAAESRCWASDGSTPFQERSRFSCRRSDEMLLEARAGFEVVAGVDIRQGAIESSVVLIDLRRSYPTRCS